MKISPYVYRDLSPMPQSEYVRVPTVGIMGIDWAQWRNEISRISITTGILAEIETLTSNVD